MKKYKIGEIAELAGVSKRTIDYYTNMGLLFPVRSESNYRFFPEETLKRLKLIESMKKKRLTLEEIRERLILLDGNVQNVTLQNKSTNVDYLKKQVKELESQIERLQTALISMEPKQAALLTIKILIQSITLMQSLMLYVNELSPEITLHPSPNPG